mmetsp:Transcript_56195/g.168235  ORF Transcript_56195/g.168235 Transcript_56195/m.168235 type:complete len:125 (+) Transcript_56195:1668-2042(+)
MITAGTTKFLVIADMKRNATTSSKAMEAIIPANSVLSLAPVSRLSTLQLIAVETNIHPMCRLNGNRSNQYSRRLSSGLLARNCDTRRQLSDTSNITMEIKAGKNRQNEKKKVHAIWAAQAYTKK